MHGGEPREGVVGEIDEVILDFLADYPEAGAYDLIRGLVGFGVYALERRHDGRAAEIASRVIDELERRAERVGGGLAWRTPGASGWELGMAHGTAGALALLARAQLARPSARIETLVRGALVFLLEARSPGTGGVRWPRQLVSEGEASPARAAWCSGDPGVAVALLLAARALREPRLEAIALDAARAVAALRPEECGVVDAGLCHGAAGLAHIYHRLHLLTGARDLAEQAAAWFARTLDDHGAGPWQFLVPRGGSLVMASDGSFLVGSAGVALALHAALGGGDPAWDRVLLLSP